MDPQRLQSRAEHCKHGERVRDGVKVPSHYFQKKDSAVVDLEIRLLGLSAFSMCSKDNHFKR